MGLAYRPDIDGLRAIAVGSVVLFHGHIPGFTGGFIGVDVFFVISGYLITSILVREMSGGSFSLLDFYDRRVRRIFPALFTMLAAATLLAAFILTPGQMMRYAESLPPAVLFFANIHFESVLDYFGPRSDQVPLLHLWSLAVEEQFYIIFPLTLLALLRLFGRRVAVAALLLVSLASLAYSQATVESIPSYAFFFLSSRAWELFAGCLLALAPLPRLSPKLASWVALAGLAAIIAPVFLYWRETVFPGLTALPPVLGTAALIYAGQHAPLGPTTRLLSHRWMVYGGRISYSLYLWHWPLLVLAAFYKGGHLTYLQAAGVILLSIVISGLSLKYIETPMRRSSTFGGRRLVRIGAGALSIVAAIGVALGVQEAGRGFRNIPPRAMAADDAIAMTRVMSRSRCFVSPHTWSRDRMTSPSDCAIGPDAAKGRYDVLVWGDSHAISSYGALSESITSLGFTARLQAMAGCSPLIGAQLRRKWFPEHTCSDFNAAVMEEIRRIRPAAVIMIGRWALWSYQPGENFWMVSDQVPGGLERSRDTTLRVFRHAVDRTLEELTALGIKVLVVGQAPEFASSPAECVVQRELAGKESDSCITRDRADAMSVIGRGNEILAEAVRKTPGSELLLLSQVFCNTDVCFAAEGNDFFYMDTDHVSYSGAERAFGLPGFEPELRRLLGGSLRSAAAPPR